MLVSSKSLDLTPRNGGENLSQSKIQKVAGSIYINPQSHINSSTTASQVLEILMTNIRGADASGTSIESIVYDIQGAMDQLPQKELSTIANTTISGGSYSQVLYDVRLHAKMLLESL